MRFLFLLSVILVFLSSGTFSQVVETSKGKIEFAGLEQWNLATIREKLGYEAPEQIFFVQHDLTDKLGFAAVSCTIYIENGKPYKFLTVLEPERAHHIRFLPPPAKFFAPPEDWTELIRVVEEKTHAFTNALVDYGSTLQGALKTEKLLLPDEEKTWFPYLQQRRSRKDFQMALKTLRQDGNYKNRVVAAMILANFPNRQQTWHSLILALRDSNELVRITSQKVLHTLIKFVAQPIRINWMPVAESIHHIFRGTNVHALQLAIKTLLKTNVSPKLAGPLLKDGGGRLILAYLNAAHEEEKTLAYQLLLKLSGRDFGENRQRWAQWVNSLS